MSDSTGAGPPAQDKDALAREKLEREVEELRQAPIRARHAQRMSLFTTILVAALSAMTTLIVAYNTYHLNSLAQKTSDELHRQDTYAKLIADLGSENAEARVGAAVGLGLYARNDPERQAQTVAILTTLLTTEKNSQVLQALIPAIVGIGAPAIDRVTELNRYAKQQYISDVRAVILPRMDNGYAYFMLATKMSSDDVGTKFTQDARDRFDKLIYRDLQPQIDLGLLTERERQAIASAVPSEYASYGHPYAVLREALFSMAAGPLRDLGVSASGLENLGVAADANDIEQADKRLPDEIRATYLTGIALSRLIAANQASVPGKKLYETAMIGADLHGVQARGAVLSDVFVIGDARDADFSESDLSSSDLSYLELAYTNLSATSLLGTRLPGEAGAWANFAKAKWSDSLQGSKGAKNVEPDGLIFSSAHPGMIADLTKGCAPPAPAITFCAGLPQNTAADFARRPGTPP